MKKRAAEAALIIIGLLLLFGAVNLAASGAEGSTVMIDGVNYSTSVRDLTLTLMTEAGVENLRSFDRLETLKIIPMREAHVNALKPRTAEDEANVRRYAEEEYKDCTRLEDLSFLGEINYIESLDISWCGVSDISFLEGFDRLVSLDISHTKVADLSVLEGLDTIETLNIAGIPAADLSPLSRMEKLSEVTVSEGMEDKVPGNVKVNVAR